MKTVKLYYVGKFNAAHYLPRHQGPCANLHGHTWKVEVWLQGHVDTLTGMVLDFGYIERVIADFDHPDGSLNELAPFLTVPPTAENIARHFAKELPLAYRIRVWESDHSYAEVDRTYVNAIRQLSPVERDRLLQGEFTNPKVREKRKTRAAERSRRRLRTEEHRLSAGFVEEIAEGHVVSANGVVGRVISRRFPTDGDRTLSQGFVEGIAEELSDADRPEPLDGTVRR